MKIGDRIVLINVPDFAKEDKGRYGTIIKIGNETICGRNVDILLDGDDGLSAVFDHQIKELSK